MNSIERVKAAIARQPVDYTPLGLYAVDKDIVSKVIGRPTYVRNRIGLMQAYWEGRRDEAIDAYKKDLVEFYQKIDCADIITERDAQIVPPKGFKMEAPKKIADDKWEDKEGRIYQAVYNLDGMSCIFDPTEPEEDPEYSIEDFETSIEVIPPDPSVFEVIDYVIEKLGHERYISGPIGHFDPMVFLGSKRNFGQQLQNGLMMYALDPEVTKTANKQLADYSCKMDQHKIRAGYHGLEVGKDFGGTNAPLIPPHTFRECCKPYFKQVVQHAKAYMKSLHKDDPDFIPQVIMHSCGNTIPIIDDFIENGVDCYQSLQTTAGMDVGMLKEKFGDRLSFWGGVSLEKLIDGTPEDIKLEVIRALQKGGNTGFILGPSQSIAMGVKYDNFMTMIDTYVNERHKFI